MITHVSLDRQPLAVILHVSLDSHPCAVILRLSFDSQPFAVILRLSLDSQPFAVILHLSLNDHPCAVILHLSSDVQSPLQRHPSRFLGQSRCADIPRPSLELDSHACVEILNVPVDNHHP